MLFAVDMSDHSEIGRCSLSPATLLRLAAHGEQDTFVLRGLRSNGAEVSCYPRAATPLDDPCGIRVPSVTLRIRLEEEPIHALLGVRILSASSRSYSKTILEVSDRYCRGSVTRVSRDACYLTRDLTPGT